MLRQPEVEVIFKGLFEDSFPPLTLYALNPYDTIQGIYHNYDSFGVDIYNFLINGVSFSVTLNDKPIRTIEEYKQNFTKRKNTLIISSVVDLQGGDIGNILLGVGFLALAFTGIGVLGISATTFGLLGASLLFSSVFKSPKSNVTQAPEKRSVNYGSTINVVGGSPVVPLCFGTGVYCGSIVVSAFLTSDSRSVS